MVRKTEGWEKINWIELLKPDYRKIILSFVLTILILAITSYWNYTSCLNRIRLVKSMGYDIGHCQFNLNPFETSFVSEVQFPLSLVCIFFPLILYPTLIRIDIRNLN